MAGGGGALNKIFPGYKDKIWRKLPLNWRMSFIKKWNNELERSVYETSVVTNMRIKSFNKYILDTLRPSYGYRSTCIDYKKQRARGTLLEGVDYYLPTVACQNRLSNFFEPYTHEENQERSKYRYQSLQNYILVALGVTVVHGWLQKRPIAWCSDIEPPRPPKYPFWFKAPLHGHDIGSIRRGFEVFRQICATCHSLKYFHFYQLSNEVYPERRAKQIAAEYDVVDGPNEIGEMYTRPGILSDPFPSPYPNIEAARYANNGSIPPDLTLMSSARKFGPDHIFGILTGYCDPPEGIELRQGLYFNNYFPGGSIAMPPPLEDGMIDYEDGTPATVSQMAKDVTSFLTWTSDPMHDERKNMCLKMLIATTLCLISATLWHRFYWSITATKRIDFGKIKHL
ncbi:bifunctional Cytochrome c-like domain/Cytochrome c1/Cytochrome c-like domain superfamily/Cytochrome c1 [Babesia duncani]|uniref:Bifunctional Cytochrome c-like domain/Cytochrome c1/Cytochrome c-like domain superfamily/Cytochrome c1 n=1 Tax=Babesia duncani TaxID=323732 RepID=A0AAD9PNT0_9APIC|nr:bifunctional Cytochrome c-like domain/Cytochrome c1/Cytochrome c-like domain superfamily/Cytochrome c1 [Babesia duncani]